MENASSLEDYAKYPCLSEQEAAARLRSGGYNELPAAKHRTVFTIAWEIAREPMFVLLIACGTIYVILGDIQEAAMLLASIFIVMAITFYQEHKTERALEALKDLSSPRARVLRGSKVRRIPGREVVAGDMVLVSEGDRVPADGILLDCANLSVDESLLTGESLPVRKLKWDGMLEMGRPGGDDLPFVYSGTLVVQGRGMAQVSAIGSNTEMGKIGKSLESQKLEKTLLQKEIKKIVKRFALFGAILCAAVIVSYGLIMGGWLRGFLSGIALAMSLLPEEFPVILTVFLALGAWRISKRRVLTRKVPVIETLGAATVLCVDKTGTLTRNQMAVISLHTGQKEYIVSEQAKGKLPEDFHGLVEFAMLASHKDPFDPMEKAILGAGGKCLQGTEHLHKNWGIVREYPLSQHLLAMSNVWVSPERTDYVVAAKGAPEAIMDLCHLDNRRVRTLLKTIDAMAGQGLRLLGIGRASFAQSNLPENVHDLDFEFLGFIGLADPVREQVPEAVKECYGAGIRTVMITGDYPGTAKKIAGEIGLAAGGIITGLELDNMTDEQLTDRIGEVNIFARVVPEQKLRIVKALKARGEVVAMTGDGVNDAPALKAAHIGIAMGQRGTDVAREAADIVLLNDDFNSIVEAVRQGRRIYGNISKAMAYVLAIHIPIAGMTLFPILLQWPSVLLPIHIVFLELIIDPACSVVFEAEPEEEGIMSRPPRRLDKGIFNKRAVIISVLQGVSILLITLGVYSVAMRYSPASEARAIAFMTLVMANLALIAADMSWSQSIAATLKNNKPLWILLICILFLLAVIVRVPFLSGFFKFTSPHAVDILLAVIASLLSVLWFESLKLLKKLPL